ncbi:MAG: class I lanthipeptide [Tannerellaceae bacterium]|nr:class I lanthipeptide [Tannerellaceae bacterium]
MKKKKLVLKKEIIVSLTNGGMRDLKGGTAPPTGQGRTSQNNLNCCICMTEADCPASAIAETCGPYTCIYSDYCMELPPPGLSRGLMSCEGC